MKERLVIIYLEYYNVVRTKRRVVLTSMTMSLNAELKAIDIWLIRRSIPVGRNSVIRLLRKGRLNTKSIIRPFLPFLSVVHLLILWNSYFPISYEPKWSTSSATIYKQTEYVKKYFQPPWGGLIPPKVSSSVRPSQKAKIKENTKLKELYRTQMPQPHYCECHLHSLTHTMPQPH